MGDDRAVGALQVAVPGLFEPLVELVLDGEQKVGGENSESVSTLVRM
jgi:hypothetical protein